MSYRKILVAEDDEKSGKMLKDFLEMNDYAVKLAENGEEALNEFKKEPCQVVITDIEMPVMDGNKLISFLKEFPIPPIIFVQTAHQEPELIIDIMRKGVYDYLTKPIYMQDLLFKVERAFEAAEMKRTQMILEEEKSIRLENHLDWYKWLNSMKTEETAHIKKSVFGNLQKSFSQGMGFGTLIIATNLISMSAKKEGNNYIIDSETFDFLQANARMADKAIKKFQKIDQILTGKFDKEQKSFEDFFGLVKNIINSTKKYQGINNQEIVLSELKVPVKSGFVEVHEEYFSEAFFEVVINALKFSEKSSKILIILRVEGRTLHISVINRPRIEDPSIQGIPIKYERIVFEPFFRLSLAVFEKFETLDFGLGLTYVENIILNHGGKVVIHNINDYSGITGKPDIKVNVSLSLPFQIN